MKKMSCTIIKKPKQKQTKNPGKVLHGIFLLDTPTHSTWSLIVSYLCCHMDIGSFLQKQGHHVRVTFLRG